MRAGLSTIQQTLTPEASAVLTAAIAEAASRGHGQTTPLHVAATLLASPAGTLRQACLRSHPTSSHPLQCRALELCFSVALDRLPTSAAAASSNSGAAGEAAVAEPPISNALMAALKRAQAHQRRGCPESQQQPLLAVKVELEQLIVSILDDPGVSRVMREASFSSPAVKAAIETTLSSAAAAGGGAGVTIPHSASPSLGLGLTAHRPQPPRNLYVNPKLQQPSPNPNPAAAAATAAVAAGIPKTDEVKRVVDILSRVGERNPVLVGDNAPEIVMWDVIQKIERGEIPAFADARVISLDKRLKSVDRAEIASKIRELGDLIETHVGKRVVIDLGDLKWLVDPPGSAMRLGPIQQQQIVTEAGRAAVTEMAKILKRFSGDSAAGGRVWLVGTATCATYLRCKVQHPTMENDWYLQALPIASRSPIPGLFPRILSGPFESQPLARCFPAITGDAQRKTSLCSLCTESYERELSKLVAKEFEKASSDSKPPLPQWLQAASNQFPVKEKEFNWKQSSEELLKRWRDTCARLHPAASGSARPPALPSRQLFHPKSLPVSSVAPLKPRLVLSSSERPASPPGSPVKTDLVLGRPRPTESPKETNPFLQGIEKDQRNAHVDVDTFKRLYTGLSEKVGWQPEAVSAVIDAVLQSKSGRRRPRGGGGGTKGDTWLMFAGPDRVGKAKMALGLSELLFGTGPVIVSFGRSHGEDGESNMNLRGRRSVDRVCDAIRQNPLSMVVLEDIDRADVVVRGTIKRAIEQGRLANSYGREVSLGSVIFVLTADWLPDDLKCAQSSLVQHEEKILDAAISGWQLELSIGEKTVKRRADWLHEDDDRPTKPPRKEPGLCLDLNLAAGIEEDHTDVSRNSSDLTVEHEHENTRLKVQQHSDSSAPELIDSMDCTIIFKPVDFAPLRRKVSEAITAKFTEIIGNSPSISVDDDVLDRMVGGVWLGGSTTRLEQWTARVLAPRIEHLKGNLKTEDTRTPTIHLSSVKNGKHLLKSGGGGGGNVDLLPTTVTVTVGGLRT